MDRLGCGPACLWGERVVLLLIYLNHHYLLLATARHIIDPLSSVFVLACTAIELVPLPI